jgi:hypothetical protein
LQKSAINSLALGAFDQRSPTRKNTRQSLPFPTCIYKLLKRHFHHGFPLLFFMNTMKPSGLPDFCNGSGERVAAR